MKDALGGRSEEEMERNEEMSEGERRGREREKKGILCTEYKEDTDAMKRRKNNSRVSKKMKQIVNKDEEEEEEEEEEEDRNMSRNYRISDKGVNNREI